MGAFERTLDLTPGLLLKHVSSCSDGGRANRGENRWGGVVLPTVRPGQSKAVILLWDGEKQQGQDPMVSVKGSVSL